MRSFLVPSCCGACLTPAHPVVDASMEVLGPISVSGADCSGASSSLIFFFSFVSSSFAFASTDDFSRRSMNGLHLFRSSSLAIAPADRCRCVASLLCPAAIFLEYSLRNSTSSPSNPGQQRS